MGTATNYDKHIDVIIIIVFLFYFMVMFFSFLLSVYCPFYRLCTTSTIYNNKKKNKKNAIINAYGCVRLLTKTDIVPVRDLFKYKVGLL